MPDRCSLEDVKNTFLGHPIRFEFALCKVNLQIEDSNLAKLSSGKSRIPRSVGVLSWPLLVMSPTIPN